MTDDRSGPLDLVSGDPIAILSLTHSSEDGTRAFDDDPWPADGIASTSSILPAVRTYESLGFEVYDVVDEPLADGLRPIRTTDHRPLLLRLASCLLKLAPCVCPLPPAPCVQLEAHGFGLPDSLPP